MQDTLAAWRVAGEGTDETFVDDLWLRVLRRLPAADERDRVLTELRLGVSRAELLHRLVVSPEFERVRLVEDAISWAAAERRHGARPRNLRAPARSGADAIAVPWCLARVGAETSVLLVAHEEPALEAALLRQAPGLLTEPAQAAGETVELAIVLAPVELTAIAGLLTRDGRILVALPSVEVADSGLLVFEEERYAPSEDGWYAVEEGGAARTARLHCAELRPDRVATRVRRALRRERA